MKHHSVTSLYFLFLLVVIILNSCADRNNLISSPTTKKIDSLNNYYKIAADKSNRKAKRLEAINNFLEGANVLKIDSLFLKGLYLQAKLSNKYEGPQEALDLSHKLLLFAKKKKDSLYMGKAYFRIGYYNKKMEKYSEAFEYFNQSFKISRGLKDSINAGKILMSMSNIQRLIGDYNACKTTATDGLKYLENSTRYHKIAGLYQNISLVYKELGHYNEALIWNSKILNLFNKKEAGKIIGLHNLPIFKNVKALILADQKKYSESIATFTMLLKDDNVIKNRKRYAQILSNTAYTKFLNKSQNTESESMLLKALDIRKQEKDHFGLFSSYIHLTKYYNEKNKEEAKKYAMEAFLLINNFNHYESQLEALTLLTELEPNSLIHHQNFKETSLKLMELRKKTREIYAPTRFENENLLKENEEKNLKIAAVRNQNTIYLLAMILLLSGIGFIIYFSRQRTKRLSQENKIIQFQASYDTETRIAKRLHDELGNDIFQAMLQYQNDPHHPQITERLNSAYNKARDISRENNDFETDETFPEELRNMLQNYTQNSIRLIIRGLDKIDWNSLEQPIKITIYRVLQELMTNMQKHSQATLVALVFSNNDDQLKINYSDNGVGVSDDCLTTRNGLRNTEKRMEAIKGTLTFDSEKEQGFKATLQIPT